MVAEKGSFKDGMDSMAMAMALKSLTRVYRYSISERSPSILFFPLLLVPLILFLRGVNLYLLQSEKKKKV